MRHVICCDETAIYEVSKAPNARIIRHNGGVRSTILPRSEG